MSDEASERDWDEFVANHPLGHHEQCSRYAQIRGRYGFVYDRAVVRQGGQIIGGAQILFQSTPIGRLAVVQRGPLAVDDDLVVLKQVVDEIGLVARTRRLMSVRVETFCPQVTARVVLDEAGFRACESWYGRRTTVIIRLRHTNDELLARMTKRGRYNIHRAERYGVDVRVGNADSIRDFFELHEMSAEYHGFVVFPRDYFEYLWNLFGRYGRAQHFVAHYKDRPVAAIFNAIVGDHMIVLWGGIHRGKAESELMANYLLHFQAMCWARDHGCSCYDLAGISECETSGVTQFKTRIAQERTHWPAPMWKCYGPLQSLRLEISEFVGANPYLRDGVTRLAGRLSHKPKMPW